MLDEKRELHVEHLVKSSKVQLPATFWLHLFLTEYLKHLGQCFFLLCTRIKDDKRNMPRKFEEILSLIKVSEGRCPKALDDFANFSVLC